MATVTQDQLLEAIDGMTMLECPSSSRSSRSATA